MPAYEPEDCDRLIIEAIHNKDVEAAVALYEPNATLVLFGSGQVVTGRQAIREVLQDVMALDLKMTMEVSVVQSGDLALTRTKGTASGIGPDGKPVMMQVNTAEIVRRQADGTWLFVVDDQTAGA